MESRNSPDQPSRDPDLEKLLLLCCHWVYAHALADGKPEQDAADIAQVAALRLLLWPNAARHPRGKWLDKLYVQCALEVRRARSSTVRLEEEELEAPSSGNQDMIERLQAAIKRLPAREAYVIRKCKLEASSPALIAEELKLKINHVHLLDSRARQRLQGYLKEDLEESGGIS